MSSDFVLTAENYYTLEADNLYCSASQFKMVEGCLGKVGCEYQYRKYLDGEWKNETTKDMLIGSYVDSRYEGTIDGFREDHPELFVSRGERKGELKQDFVKAEEIYQRLQRDKLFSQFMDGEKQVIMTGDISGLPFKIKMDSLHRGKCIVDLKVMQDIKKVFWTKDYGHMDFVTYWGYDIQLAIYQEIYRQNTGETLPCYIAAADKGKHTNFDVIYVDNDRLRECLENVKTAIPTIAAVRSREIEPIRCGVCDCCIENKVLEKPIHFSELVGDI